MSTEYSANSLRVSNLIFALIGSLVFTACGGGGGGESSTTNTSPAATSASGIDPSSSPAPVTAASPAAGFGPSPAFDTVIVDAANAGLQAVGDFDGDGRVEMMAVVPGATSFDEPNTYLYKQDVNGIYQRSLWKSGSVLVQGEADLDGDGRTDVIVASLDGSCSWTAFLGNTDLSFSPAPSGPFSPGDCGTSPVSIVDFNGDGKLDVFPLSSYTGSIALGTTSGFDSLPQQRPYALQGQFQAVADLDKDGSLEVIAMNPHYSMTQWSMSVAFGAGKGDYSNIKSWVFSNLTGGYSTPGGQAVVSDINNDGFPDIIYCPGGGDCMILLANAPATFDNAPALISVGFGHVDVADINGDGNVDLVVNSTNGVEVRLGNGSGQFAQPVVLGVANIFSPGYLRVADFNGDGKLDVAVNNDGQLKLFLQR